MHQWRSFYQHAMLISRISVPIAICITFAFPPLPYSCLVMWILTFQRLESDFFPCQEHLSIMPVSNHSIKHVSWFSTNKCCCFYLNIWINFIISISIIRIHCHNLRLNVNLFKIHSNTVFTEWKVPSHLVLSRSFSAISL